MKRFWNVVHAVVIGIAIGVFYYLPTKDGNGAYMVAMLVSQMTILSSTRGGK